MPVSITSPAQLRDMVRGAYSSSAERPKEKHAFPVGRQFAESIGYPADLLASLPRVACEAFIARVIKPAGTLFSAELILSQPLPPETRASETDWFA